VVIYEILIRHPELCRHLLEIRHRRRIEADGDTDSCWTSKNRILFFLFLRCRLPGGAQQREPVFIARVIGIDDQAGALVRTRGLRFLDLDLYADPRKKPILPAALF